MAARPLPIGAATAPLPPTGNKTKCTFITYVSQLLFITYVRQLLFNHLIAYCWQDKQTTNMTLFSIFS